MTAVEKGDGTLDKEATSHDDCLDAFRMSLQYWIVRRQSFHEYDFYILLGH